MRSALALVMLKGLPAGDNEAKVHSALALVMWKRFQRDRRDSEDTNRDEERATRRRETWQRDQRVKARRKKGEQRTEKREKRKG